MSGLSYHNGTIFLFGFTYLYVGLTNILKLDSSGVGYYSLWVAIIATVMGIVNQLHEWRPTKY